jgi:hypothetical protein
MFNESMAKELCFKFILANSESEVKAILHSYDYTKNLKNWVPLGKNQNNAAIVQNTAGNLGSCLTELSTNSIDAVIQREKNTLEKNGIEIPQESLKNPEAFLRFALKEDYLKKSDLEKYAKKHMKLLTTETKDGKRSLTLVDAGCGQQAKNFGDTFCSVGSGHQNKANKSWLHGNYGQGSTSANAISGCLGYKLIVSREEETQKWGFTLVRRSEIDPSMLEYLVVNGGESVLEFEEDYIEFGVRYTGKLAIKEAELNFGSAIKLYSVKVEKGFTGVKRTMSSVLFRPALPLSSTEFSDANENANKRDGSKPNGRDCRWIWGLGKELSDLVEDGKAELATFSINCPIFEGTAYGKVYFIRSQEDVKSILNWMPYSYLEKNKRVFHINNGQVQHTDAYQKLEHLGFVKSAQKIFIEMDLSHFNPAKAKAYLWKADRTSFQTSQEYFQLYDESVNAFLKNFEKLKNWEEIARQDEMEKVKNEKNAQTDNVLSEIIKLFGGRESKKMRSNKVLISSQENKIESYVQGVSSDVSENEIENESKNEVQGEEIPTELYSDHGSKENAKKGNIKNLTTVLKTNAKNGSVGSKDGKNNLTIKSATVMRDGIEINVDVNQINLSISQKTGGTDVQLSITSTDDLKSKVEIGDILSVKLEMNNEQNKSIILESVVYFELIDELKKIESSRVRSNDLANMLAKAYGSKDGRKINDEPTTNLMDDNSDFALDKVGYKVISQNDKLVIVLNLDNLLLKINMDRLTREEDKVNYMNHWEATLFLNVINSYEMHIEQGLDNLHELANELNSVAAASLANRNALQTAMRNVKQEEEVIKKSLTRKVA